MENECQPQKGKVDGVVANADSICCRPDPICTDGVERLRLRVYGDPGVAQTLIYLPGVQGDWTMIGAFRQALGDRICWVEMTYPRSLTWCLADYAREIEKALVERGVHRGWLLGESFGSQVMWELVERAPHRWQGLILAGGFVKYPSSRLLAAARFLCPRISHRLLHQCLPAYILYAHLRHSASPTLIDGARDFVARRTVADQHALLHRLHLIAESDPRAVASACRIPLHHLYGALDPIVPWSGVVSWLEENCPALRASRRIWLSDHTVLATAAGPSAAQIRQWMA